MSIENIVFEDTDSLKDTAIKLALIFAGPNELKNQMKRLGVNYVKIERGVKTLFILRHKTFGRVEVKL